MISNFLVQKKNRKFLWNIYVEHNFYFFYWKFFFANEKYFLANFFFAVNFYNVVVYFLSWTISFLHFKDFTHLSIWRVSRWQWVLLKRPWNIEKKKKNGRIIYMFEKERLFFSILVGNLKLRWLSKKLLEKKIFFRVFFHFSIVLSKKKIFFSPLKILIRNNWNNRQWKNEMQLNGKVISNIRFAK